MSGRLLFSYAGKPPGLTGSREINLMAQDDGAGWRYIFEQCGGNGVTKRSIESQLTPLIGPFDWGNDDLEKPLDLGKFFAEVAKLQSGHRIVALNWAYAKQLGQNVRADPKSVMMTRTRFVPENYTRTPEQVTAEAKAAFKKSEIEADQKIIAAQERANQKMIELELKASQIASERKHVIPPLGPDPPVVGRSVDDLVAWRRLFEFIDADDMGRVTKARTVQRLGSFLPKFPWTDVDERLMNYNDFVDLMVALPLEERYAALSWAKKECPQKVHPVGGGPPRFTHNGLSFSPVSALRAPMDTSEVKGWWKLFNLIDGDRSGAISKRTINGKLAPMVGAFDWEDVNADGTMDFAEFCKAMNDLPLSRKFTCLKWAQSYCPDKTLGAPPPAVNTGYKPTTVNTTPIVVPATIPAKPAPKFVMR